MFIHSYNIFDFLFLERWLPEGQITAFAETTGVAFECIPLDRDHTRSYTCHPQSAHSLIRSRWIRPSKMKNFVWITPSDVKSILESEPVSQRQQMSFSAAKLNSVACSPAPSADSVGIANSGSRCSIDGCGRHHAFCARSVTILAWHP